MCVRSCVSVVGRERADTLSHYPVGLCHYCRPPLTVPLLHSILPTASQKHATGAGKPSKQGVASSANLITNDFSIFPCRSRLSLTTQLQSRDLSSLALQDYAATACVPGRRHRRYKELQSLKQEMIHNRKHKCVSAHTQTKGIWQEMLQNSEMKWRLGGGMEERKREKRDFGEGGDKGVRENYTG